MPAVAETSADPYRPRARSPDGRRPRARRRHRPARPGDPARQRQLDGRGGRALGDPRARTAPARPRCSRSAPRRSTRAAGWPASSARCSAPSTCSSCAPDRATSAAIAERIPRDERVRRRRRLGVVRRDRALARALRRARPRPRRRAAGRGRRRPPRRPHVRHPERGRAQAGPDRPGADDRPGAAAARRARRRPRPRRPRGPGLHAVGARAGRVLAGDGAGLPPRRGDPAGLHPRAAAARGRGRGRRAGRRGDDRGDPLRDVRRCRWCWATRTAATRPAARRAATGAEPVPRPAAG